MRRWMLAILMAACMLLAAAPAEAHGWRHWGGYRWGHHWGGYRWGHVGWRHHGYWRGGWGGYAYRPYFAPRVYSYYPGVYWGGYNYYPYQGCSTEVYLDDSAAFVSAPQAPVLNNVLQGDLVSQLVARLAENRNRQVVSQERVISTQARQQARSYLAQGDQYFRDQEYHIAAQRYKSAASSAPDMAEAYWRIGHAYVASNRYELASGAYKRAIALDPAIARGVDLTALYGDSKLSQGSHVEALAAAALAGSDASEPFFLLGVQLHFSGEQERASKFFAHAAGIVGPQADHIAAFGRFPAVPLAPVAPAAAPQPPLVLVSTQAREL